METDLAAIADAIAEDQRMLEEISRRLRIRRNAVKEALASLSEIVGRVKLNGRLLSRSPLSDVLELEALTAGIDAKRSLWRSLQAAAIPALRDIDFELLIERATEQRERLMPAHQHAAARAFAD
jgi:hypothetical protein